MRLIFVNTNCQSFYGQVFKPGAAGSDDPYYVAPFLAPTRRSFLYEAEAGEVPPAFCFRDLEYCQWRFCFAAVDTARLSVIKNGATKRLKERFDRKAGIRNYEKEGFDGGQVDQYRINTLTEEGFIRRSQHEREHMADGILWKHAVIFLSSEGCFLADNHRILSV